MTDDFADIPDEKTARERRLQIRAVIRAHNHIQPRCSGCGLTMLLFKPEDIITEERYNAEGYDYLKAQDFRPGDLVCFECEFAMMADEEGRTGFFWGHA